MELTKEFIEQHGLQENQVEAITKYVSSEIVPNIKKEYDGVANKNAEGILSGAADFAKQSLGVNIDREQGEKLGDYLKRISETHFSKASSDLQAKQKEIDEKLANFKGGDEYKAQLEQLKADKDNLLKKVAELEPLSGIEEKYRQATEQLTGMKKEVAYNSVKPNFPDTVNKYEADAKWGAWKSMVEEKYNIELVEGKPIAVDKENQHKTIELSELIAQDKNIADLLQGRQQRGTGAKPTEFIDGLEVKVPKGATSEEQSKAVKEYLIEKLGDPLHKDFSKQFLDLLAKVKASV